MICDVCGEESPLNFPDSLGEGWTVQHEYGLRFESCPKCALAAAELESLWDSPARAN